MPNLFCFMMFQGNNSLVSDPIHSGGVAEWFKAVVLKTAVPERAP